MSAAPAAEAWQEEYERILPQLQQLQQQQAPPWPLRVLRSSQLDALRLDEELLAMLQEQFSSIFSLFAPGRIAAWEPELTAIMLFLVYRLSVGRGRASPGSELMNLRYRDERAMAAAAIAHAAPGAAEAGRPSGAAAATATPTWLHGGPTGVEGPGLSPQQKGMYFCGTVLLPYLWVRASRAAVNADWGHSGADPTSSSSNWFHEEEEEAANSSSSSGDGWALRMWRALRWLEGSYRAASVVNMWLFLYDGRYRTILERVMGARLVYKQPNMKRMISFEYLNRQLVWQELSEFLLFLLPLLNTDKLKQMVTQVFPRLSVAGGGVAVQQYFRAPEQQQQQQQDSKPDWSIPSTATKLAPHAGGAVRSAGLLPGAAGQGSAAEPLHGTSTTTSSSSSQQEGHAQQQQQKPPDPIGPCPICGTTDIPVAFLALPCRHVFCYYCLRSHCQADARYRCPVDGLRVTAMQRYLPPWPGAGATAAGAISGVGCR